MTAVLKERSLKYKINAFSYLCLKQIIPKLEDNIIKLRKLFKTLNSINRHFIMYLA